MKQRNHHFLRHGLSLLLALGSMTQVSALSVLESTTTLALIYDEPTSVFNCDIKESITMDLPEIQLLTLTVPLAQVDQKIHDYALCEGITSVYEVTNSSLALVPVDPFYTQGKQYNLSGIDLPLAWDITTGSPEVIVAVIDTGVSSSSALTDFGSDGLVLGASIINGVTREDTYVGQYSYDGGAHGTAVASLISANMNSTGLTGVASGVKIMPLKVFRDALNSSDVVSALNTDIAAAILWAVNHGADIINMSLGGNSDTATQSAIQVAYEQGVILVAASGNDSNNASGIYRNVSYPAAYPQVIAVGSLTSTQTVSYFSNVFGTGLDLSAYGEAIYLPWLFANTYGYASGTSFSSPTVAGVLALMKSIDPSLTPSEAKAVLLSGVIDIAKTDYAPGWDKWTGYGMVNAFNALVQAQDFMTYTDTNFDVASAAFIYGKHAYTTVLKPALDVDYFTFTLYEQDTVTITLSTNGIHDLMFQVLNEDQAVLRSIDEQDSGTTETVTLTSLNSGSYTVKVTDYEGRAYVDPYTIQVDYASLALPEISAVTSQGTLNNGQMTALPVTIGVKESLYHTISVTQEALPIAWPQDGTFSEVGTYVVSVDDFVNPLQQFSFTIIPAAGVQDNGYYNTDRIIVFNGTATLNGSPFISGSTVTTEGSYTLIITNGETTTTIHFVLDKTKPVITVAPYSTEPTNQDVIISAFTDEGSLNASSHTFTENGSFTFIATDLSGNQAETTITITHIHKVTSVSLNKAKTYLYALGNTESMVVSVNPSDALDKSVLWSSSDPTIVSVDQEGLITANAVGEAIITVTSVEGNHSATLEVEVVLSRRLTFEVIGTQASLSVRHNESTVISDSDVQAGSELTFTLTLAPRTRLYHWIINGEIQANTTTTLVTTIGPSDLVVQADIGLIGDLNLTNDVSTTDLVLLRRYLAGLENLDPKDIFNADMNGDGFITTTDLVKLRRYLAGLE